MSAQIPFDLAPNAAQIFDNFIPSACNNNALVLVRQWRDWPSPIVLIHGPEGCGKTHLGRAWAVDVGGQSFDAVTDVSLADMPDGPLFLDNANTADEAALFALLNSALNGERTALLLAQRPPVSQNLPSLPDLRSRLLATPDVAIEEPDDGLLEDIVRGLFIGLGRDVKRDVVIYLIARSERTVSALRDVVTELDARARSEKADLTRSFAAKHLPQL
ncbi:MAG: hypothetical protein ACPGVT_03345 [Maricaulaceae bacterium]